MIAIVSSVARERAALAALCEARNWPSLECDSLRAFTGELRRNAPRVVVVRQKLVDGYADDLMAHLHALRPARAIRLIVLIAAGSSSALEARHIALGADCVQRDPVRIDVLLEYLTKYYAAPPNGASASAVRPKAKRLTFAGAVVDSADRTLRRGEEVVQLTPRELALVEMFVAAEGEVVTYEAFYGEVLGRRFRGDTSNLRVLVGKLSTSAAKAGVPLRRWITVIPKAGYRYASPSAPA